MYTAVVGFPVLSKGGATHYTGRRSIGGQLAGDW